MFVPQVFDGSIAGARPPLSEHARSKRIAQIGLAVVADNGRCLAAYTAEPQVATKKHDPIETEALRLAERIRTDHKQTSASCGDRRSEFEVPEWSCQDVFYRALAMLNSEGIRLANMRVGRSEGTMCVSFFDAPIEQYQ